MSYPQQPSIPPPLDWPHYGIGSIGAVKRAYRKYATFTGRASRSEYWWFVFYLTLVYLVLGIATAAVGIATSPDGGDTPGALAAIPGVPLALIMLASIVPSIALSWRRLHDAGYSGLLYLLTLTYIGGFVLIIFLAMPTSPGAARYGPPVPTGYPPQSFPSQHPYSAQNFAYQPQTPYPDHQPYQGQPPYQGQQPYQPQDDWRNPTSTDHPGQPLR